MPARPRPVAVAGSSTEPASVAGRRPSSTVTGPPHRTTPHRQLHHCPPSRRRLRRPSLQGQALSLPLSLHRSVPASPPSPGLHRDAASRSPLCLPVIHLYMLATLPSPVGRHRRSELRHKPVPVPPLSASIVLAFIEDPIDITAGVAHPCRRLPPSRKPPATPPSPSPVVKITATVQALPCPLSPFLPHGRAASSSSRSCSLLPAPSRHRTSISPHPIVVAARCPLSPSLSSPWPKTPVLPASVCAAGREERHRPSSHGRASAPMCRITTTALIPSPCKPA